MARVYDREIIVTGVTDESVSIQSGAEGFTFTKQELLDAINGSMDKRAMLLGNIATNLSMFGVNLADDIAVKAAIESRTYKVIE